MLAVICGCVPFNYNGKRHTVILGFGIVTTGTTNEELATIARTRAIGIATDSTPSWRAMVGYTHSTVISVKTNSNLLIEINKNTVHVP